MQLVPHHHSGGVGCASQLSCSCAVETELFFLRVFWMQIKFLSRFVRRGKWRAKYVCRPTRPRYSSKCDENNWSQLKSTAATRATRSERLRHVGLSHQLGSLSLHRERVSSHPKFGSTTFSPFLNLAIKLCIHESISQPLGKQSFKKRSIRLPLLVC